LGKDRTTLQKVTNFRWEWRAGKDPGSALQLAESLGVSPLLAAVLCQRGIGGADEAQRFLDSRLSTMPDPFLLRDMEKAVDRLALAVRSGEPIAVHGDYDVDGITGTALLVEMLRRFGGVVDYFIPLRLKDGYGLSGEALQRAAAAGAKVAVSVDCGVSALEEARLARKIGLDLIVTDHHQPPESLPEALAVVNPCRSDCEFPAKNLSGVGVAFMLLVALRARLRRDGHFARRAEPDLRRSLDLVAMGTIADIVPLTGLNRTLVKSGLEVLSRGGRPGLDALKAVAAVKDVTCGDVWRPASMRPGGCRTQPREWRCCWKITRSGHWIAPGISTRSTGTVSFWSSRPWRRPWRRSRGGCRPDSEPSYWPTKAGIPG
jgi:single-stranded-DNA-specific exonuclease